MVKIRILTKPTKEEVRQIVALYASQGWWEEGEEGPEMVGRIVEGSHCFVVAEDGGGIVGFGRAISDGASDAYVQDVLVAPDYRGAGVGALIVRRIVDAVHEDGLRWIGVVAEKGSAPFYARLGFKQMEGATPMLKKK